MADDPDREIAQGREHSRQGPGADLGSVLVEGVVTNPAQAFNRPVSPHESDEMLDAGVLLGEVGDVEAGLDADLDVIEGRPVRVRR